MHQDASLPDFIFHCGLPGRSVVEPDLIRCTRRGGVCGSLGVSPLPIPRAGLVSVLVQRSGGALTAALPEAFPSPALGRVRQLTGGKLSTVNSVLKVLCHCGLCISFASCAKIILGQPLSEAPKNSECDQTNSQRLGCQLFSFFNWLSSCAINSSSIC